MVWTVVAGLLSFVVVSSSVSAPLTSRDLGPGWHQVSKSRVNDTRAKDACNGLKVPALGTVQLTRFTSGTGAANVDVYVSKPRNPATTFEQLRTTYGHCTLHVVLTGKHGTVTAALNSNTDATNYGRIGRASFGSQVAIPSPRGPAYYVQEFTQTGAAIAEVVYTGVVPPGRLVKRASGRVASNLARS